MAFGKMFGGTLGVISAVAVAVVLPITMAVKGIQEAWKDNPEGVDDWDYNIEQFKEGATFGIYEANKGVTGENVTNKTLDAAEEAAEFVKESKETVKKRIEDKGLKLPFGTDPCDDPERRVTKPECFEQNLPSGLEQE